MSFFIHLFSDSSYLYCSQNTSCTFVSKLPQRIDLARDLYEVTLTDISFMNSFFTLPSEVDRTLYLTNKSKSQKIILPNLVYKSAFDVKDEISNELAKITPNATISDSSKLNRFFIRLNIFGLHFKNKALPEILVFSNQISFVSGDHLGTEPPKTLLTHRRIFVACNLVKPQIMGNQVLPIIATLNNTGGLGLFNSVSVTPYYLPLSVENLDYIKVSFYNEFGELLTQPVGRTQVSFYFRKL